MYEAMIHMIDMGYKDIHSNCAYEPEWSVEDARIFYEQGKKIADEFLRRDLDFEQEYYVSIFESDFFHPKEETDLENWCGGDGKMIACDWDGEIYPCIRYMEMSLGDDQPKLPIGNVDDGVAQNGLHKCNLDCLTCIDRRTQSTDECFNCPIAEGCSWCTAWNYQLFGTPDKRCTNICIMHKSRALFNAYFWNKYYKQKGLDKAFEMHIPDEWALEIISQDELDKLKSLSKKESIDESYI
jgi:radical SAM peptide maturase (CXXX-repeat target family)